MSSRFSMSCRTVSGSAADIMARFKTITRLTRGLPPPALPVVLPGRNQPRWSRCGDASSITVCTGATVFLAVRNRDLVRRGGLQAELLDALIEHARNGGTYGFDLVGEFLEFGYVQVELRTWFFHVLL